MLLLNSEDNSKYSYLYQNAVISICTFKDVPRACRWSVTDNAFNLEKLVGLVTTDNGESEAALFLLNGNRVRYTAELLGVVGKLEGNFGHQVGRNRSTCVCLILYPSTHTLHISYI